MAQHRHSKSARECGDIMSDMAQSDEAKHLAAKLRPHQVPAREAPVSAHAAVILRETLGEVEHQPNHVPSDRRRTGTGLIHDRHAGLGAGGDGHCVMVQRGGMRLGRCYSSLPP